MKFDDKSGVRGAVPVSPGFPKGQHPLAGSRGSAPSGVQGDIEKVCEPLFHSWKSKRKSKESFGNFTNRVKLQEIVDKWEGVPKSSSRYYLKFFTDKETFEDVDALARVANKSAHQLAMEVIHKFAASQQNGKMGKSILSGLILSSPDVLYQ
uniref:Uncharacterized protein n=1 Tax=Lactuca sativa TaxID=4236 RepID=A0A9R1WDF9_LACSA|nr:hypothetical protein LSAT_V11C200061360 [Lactuca sativa]